MFLADDNFATIVAVIVQGRNIYNNIRKAVLFLLPQLQLQLWRMPASWLL